LPLLPLLRLLLPDQEAKGDSWVDVAATQVTQALEEVKYLGFFRDILMGIDS